MKELPLASLPPERLQRRPEKPLSLPFLNLRFVDRRGIRHGIVPVLPFLLISCTEFYTITVY
jgi:hypothetical protein